MFKFVQSFLLLSSLTFKFLESCDVEVSLPRLPTHEIEGIPRSGKRPSSLIPKLIPSSSPAHAVLCYYGYWANYRTGSGQLAIEDIDASLCTHLIYAFAGLDHESKIKSIDPLNDLDEVEGQGKGKNGYRRFNELKKSNSNLRTLIGVGGFNEGSIRYSSMANNVTARKIFASSVARFLEEYSFDGMDLAWEYPSNRGGSPLDKQNYVALLQDLHEVLKPKGFLLTASLSSTKGTIDAGYDVAKISEYLDLLNIMAFDYLGGWKDRTGHHAPLFARPREQAIDTVSNVNYSIHYWLAKGAPRNKVILGLPMFGRSFTMKDGEECQLGAKVASPGQPGPQTQELGSLGFNEICLMQKQDKWTVNWDSSQLVPFACHDSQFVGYDDTESIVYKARFAKTHNLAGVMIVSIENDDVSGRCFDNKYPLTKAVIKELTGSNSTIPVIKSSVDSKQPDNGLWTSTTTDRPLSWSFSTAATVVRTSSTTMRTTWPSWTSQSSSGSTWWSTASPGSSSTWWPTASSGARSTWWPTTTTTTTTLKPIIVESSSSPSSSSPGPSPPTTFSPGIDKGVICKYPGTFIHPYDCRKFYRCVRISIGERYKIYEYDCPPNTLFDVNSRNCLWDYLVADCRDSKSPSRVLKSSPK